MHPIWKSDVMYANRTRSLVLRATTRRGGDQR